VTKVSVVDGEKEKGSMDIVFCSFGFIPCILCSIALVMVICKFYNDIIYVWWCNFGTT
jgi:hypothetical protein